MNYHLLFQDDSGAVRDICEAEIASEDTAICWMQIVGAVWFRHKSRDYDWSRMELWCRGRCVIQVDADVINSFLVSAGSPSATSTSVGQSLKFPGARKSRH